MTDNIQQFRSKSFACAKSFAKVSHFAHVQRWRVSLKSAWLLHFLCSFFSWSTALGAIAMIFLTKFCLSKNVLKCTVHAGFSHFG